MTFNSDTSNNIRLLDMTHDLDQVADLIEICFIHQMDPDGKRYLQQIRSAAKNRFTAKILTNIRDANIIPNLWLCLGRKRKYCREYHNHTSYAFREMVLSHCKYCS